MRAVNYSLLSLARNYDILTLVFSFNNIIYGQRERMLCHVREHHLTGMHFEVFQY